MRAVGASHLLTAAPEHIRYLTGFRGEDSAAVVSGGAIAVITDARYSEEAGERVEKLRKEGVRARLVMRGRKGLAATAAEAVKGRSPVLGVEERRITAATWKALGKLLRGKGKVKAADGIIREERAVKDGWELRTMRKAVRIAEKAIEDVRGGIRPGLTERRIAMMLHAAMVHYGADGPSFPTIVAAGAGSSRPHYETSDRRVKKGEPVLIDWGARTEGYGSDLTRVFFAGRMKPPAGRAYAVLLEAREAAIKAVRPGVAAGEVDAAARRAIESAGYGGRFTHALGHGLGLEVHEAPLIGAGSREKLQEGVVFTIEPGIYVPGRWGLRLEDDFAITAGGRTARLGSLPLEPEWAVTGE
ncbi:MAG: aminopeptidase P family protein [Planctomycetes bacterium]|nr:aminopeptidase P family protein [Planctomycetota bacterium]